MSSSFADSLDQIGAHSPFSSFDSTVADSPPPIYVSAREFVSDPAYFSSETNHNGPILPPPAEMDHEESYALREWRRQNTFRLEEKEKKEKDLLSQIIVQAEEFKVEFQRKRQVASETNRVTNREREQLFVANLEKFHGEADKDYWKSIAELIPKDVPRIKKRKDKKDEEKKASIAVVQGPKPGKPTDLTRMRQLLVKLKQNTPSHLNQSPTAGGVVVPNEPAVDVTAEPVAVA